MDALHDFVDLDHDPESAKAKEGKAPATIIRDASWLLYRLEQLPGTHHVRVDGHMAVLEQRDGVNAETLNFLYRLKIPFKAYDREIKLDLAQLMENAFHWSVELKRNGDVRKEDLEKPFAKQEFNPPQLIEDLKQVLYSGNARAIEMNEQQQFWVLDHSKAMHGQPQHHSILAMIDGAKIEFNDRRQLVVERSDVRRDDIAGNSDGKLRTILKHSDDGQSVLLYAPHVVVMVVAKQLNLVPDPAQPGQLTIPAAQETLAQHTLDEALRYTYWLSKATGSERQTLKGMRLDAANQQVSIKLPELSLFAGPNRSEQFQKIRHALSHPELKILLETLRNGLPDVRFIGARHANLHQLVTAVRPQIKILQRMHSMLDGLVLPHGAMAEETIVPLKSLDTALDALGLLLHEIASLRHTKKDLTQSSEVGTEAIADAQEKLSNVVYGLKHLKEDIETLNKTIVGTSHGNARALLREQGESMVYALVDESRAALRFNPNVNLVQHLQPYLTQMCELFGVEKDSDAMQMLVRQALRRHMESPESKKDKSLQHRTLINHLLSIAYPQLEGAERSRFGKQFFSDKSPFGEQELYVAGARPYTMSQDEWRGMLLNAQGSPRKFLGTDREDWHYRSYMKHAIDRPAVGVEQVTKEVPDYIGYQKRKALLLAIHATREEVIDLAHALPHALRALSQLAVILDQEKEAPSHERSTIGHAVKEVLEPITTSPMTVGITANPINHIREQIAQQKASIQTNFLGLLARNKITPISTDDGVTLASADVVKLFGVWQRLEKSGKLTKSDRALPREQRDTIRELHPLTIAHEEIGKVTLNVDSGHVKLKVKKPDNADKWEAMTKDIGEYARQHQLQFTVMPTYNEVPATHEIYLRPLAKTVGTPNVKVMAESVEIMPPQRTRHERLRKAVRAVDLPSVTDWPKETGR